MTSYAKPTQLPRWAETTGQVEDANLTEPASGQKDTGWTLSQVPPSSYENWRSNRTYKWLAWIDERWFDADVTGSADQDSIRFVAGDDGDISLQAGDGAAEGGEILIAAGTTTTSGSGGETEIYAGAAAGTDQNGGILSLYGGQGTGTGTSLINLVAATAGTTGSSLNSHETYLQIDGGNEQIEFLKPLITTTLGAVISQDPGTHGVSYTIGGDTIRGNIRAGVDNGRTGFLYEGNTDLLSDTATDGAFVFAYPFADSANNDSPVFRVLRVATGATLAERAWINQRGAAYFEGDVGIGVEPTGTPPSLSSSLRFQVSEDTDDEIVQFGRTDSPSFVAFHAPSGSPQWLFDVNSGGQTYNVGLDDADNDTFKISVGGDLGTALGSQAGDFLVIDTRAQNTHVTLQDTDQNGSSSLRIWPNWYDGAYTDSVHLEFLGNTSAIYSAFSHSFRDFTTGTEIGNFQRIGSLTLRDATGGSETIVILADTVVAPTFETNSNGSRITGDDSGHLYLDCNSSTTTDGIVFTHRNTTDGVMGGITFENGGLFSVGPDGSNFSLDYDSGTAPRFTFDSGDYIEYNRSSNYFAHAIGSSEIMRITDIGIQPMSTDMVPATGEPETLTRNNSIVASVNSDGDTTTPSVNTRHWNVDSISRDSLGVYTVTLDEAISTSATCIAQLQDQVGHAYSSPATSMTIEVRTFDSTGSADDLPFSLIVVGTN